jgi:hypothetical protein
MNIAKGEIQKITKYDLSHPTPGSKLGRNMGPGSVNDVLLMRNPRPLSFPIKQCMDESLKSTERDLPLYPRSPSDSPDPKPKPTAKKPNPNSAPKDRKWYPGVPQPIKEAGSMENSGYSSQESPGNTNEKFINIMITESVKNEHRAKSSQKSNSRKYFSKNPNFIGPPRRLTQESDDPPIIIKNLKRKKTQNLSQSSYEKIMGGEGQGDLIVTESRMYKSGHTSPAGSPVEHNRLKTEDFRRKTLGSNGRGRWTTDDYESKIKSMEGKNMTLQYTITKLEADIITGVDKEEIDNYQRLLTNKEKAITKFR